MRTIENEYFSFSFDEKGRVYAIRDVPGNREFCHGPAEIFRMRCQGSDHSRLLVSGMQDMPQIIVTNSVITIFYPFLKLDNDVLDIKLMIMLALKQDQLIALIQLENNSNYLITGLFPMIPANPAADHPPLNILGNRTLEAGKSYQSPPLPYPFENK
ncbi:MAG: hypothetical protein IJP04_07565 [Clostridia bacterium]|nr:hypothetical protein [Clostridia bacterium]